MAFEQQQTAPLIGGWAVDLTREESVQAQLLLAKENGVLRKRKALWIFNVLLIVSLLYVGFLDWVEYHTVDPVVIFCILLQILLVLLATVIMPATIKKNAGIRYDRAKQSGNTYYGELRIFSNSIEKIGDTTEAKIPLNDETLFIESKDLMLFYHAGSLLLALPARCMTEEMANAVRAAADRLALRNRRFVARFSPQAQPVALPVNAEKPQLLWESTFTYTPDEYVAVTRPVMTARFWKNAPFFVIISVLAGLMVGWDGVSFLPSVLVFLAMMALLTALSLWLPMRRLSQQKDMLDEDTLTVSICIDTMAVWIKSKKTARLPMWWADVDHVYDSDPFVQFVAAKQMFFYIPKRCIEDISAFEALIDGCKEKHKV